MTKERRLGRGLEALLSRAGTGTPPTGTPSPQPWSHPQHESPDSAAPSAPLADSALPAERVAATSAPTHPLRLKTALIDSNPFQPRQDFDEAELDELAGSMRSHGLLQPVVVRRIADRYQLVAGERRLRAAGRAGWEDVPVQVIEADDRQMAELAIIENVQRKDLNALEKAGSFQRYLQQYGCTQEELARRLNLDRSTIANLIRLLELPDAVQDSVRQGKVTQGHARALLPLGDEREQVDFCRRILDEGLSVRQTEALVQDAIAEADAEPLSLVGRDGIRTRRQGSEHTAALEQEFRAALGLKVKLTHNAGGRGKLVIHFASHDDFDRLHEYLCGAMPIARVG
ncbi:MAG: ParB/RepB/Spo0J family partition protein [Rhodopirellula sp.]|nr:ParB/RepB/Spo0J family partition protein [Rhodopirellula sp.]